MGLAQPVELIYIDSKASENGGRECKTFNVLDVVAPLVSELLAVSGILMLSMFVPGPKYMSDEKKSRRRFLSGGAAAPFIMTVHPGSVLAASSTSCFVNAGKQVTPEILPDPVSTGPNAPDPDIWLRRAIKLIKLKDGTNPELADIYLRPFAGHTNVYWKFVSNTSAPVITSLVPGLLTEREVGTKQALLLVDNTGNIVGFQWETGIPGGKITKSCYTSFKP